MSEHQRNRRELREDENEIHHHSHEKDSTESNAAKKRRRDDHQSEKQLIDEFKTNDDEQSEIRDKQNGSTQLDSLYASKLPSSDFYEKSYMHRDVVTHIIVTVTDFLITGSADGHIKFWKIITADYLKQQQTTPIYQQTKVNNDEQDRNPMFLNGPIEFVKHFRAHLGYLIETKLKNICNVNIFRSNLDSLCQ